MKIEEILGRLRRNKDLAPVHHQIKKWLKESNFQQLKSLVLKLVEDWTPIPTEEWRYTNILHWVLDGLLQYDTEHITAVFDILTIPVPQHHIRTTPNQIGAKLTALQSIETLNNLILDYAESHFELCAILVHECVLRYGSITEYAQLTTMAEKVKSTKHPLGVLPLHLLPHEHYLQAFMRYYGEAISSSYYPSPTNPNPIGNQPSGLQLQRIINNDEARMMAAFDNWQKESNGKTETAQFTSDTEIASEAISQTSLLLEIGLECLKNTSASNVFLREAKPSDILNTLFCAGANGGAYNQGLGHAYGRLKMWESVAGLMNIPMSTSIEQLHNEMDSCIWFEFYASFPSWFYQVAWDAGIVVIGMDGKTLNIVAATDTD